MGEGITTEETTGHVTAAEVKVRDTTGTGRDVKEECRETPGIGKETVKGDDCGNTPEFLIESAGWIAGRINRCFLKVVAACDLTTGVLFIVQLVLSNRVFWLSRFSPKAVSCWQDAIDIVFE